MLELTTCPRLVIGGTGSGVGKTSLALGLARALARQGLRVQTFKVGPDFLDPSYLAMASGRTCYNLDGWMTSRRYVERLFARTTADADIAVVEGVMGMFDGACASSLEGSTAEIAGWLAAPVILVVNAHGVARSLAATVMGFARFEPEVQVAGVIANQSGSRRHRDWLAESLAAAELPPLVGAVPRGALPSLASRHLGLVTADRATVDPQVIEKLAHACQEHLDLSLLLELARSAQASSRKVPHDQQLAEMRDAEVRPRIRLGIARDEAFHFYYPDNLEALQRRGAQLVPFSPIRDRQLPQDLDALYFGGGYPELYAEKLSANGTMLDEVRRFADSGRCVYAECGGLIYLGRSVEGLDGRRFPLAGVLPLDTSMRKSLKVLGYTEVAFTAECLWGPAGQTCRGHEFHYSEITAEDGRTQGWQPAYSVRRRRAGGQPGCEGFSKGSVQAGYIHLHWASRPEIVDYFISRCEERR